MNYVNQLMEDVALLRKLLWLRHDNSHFSALYGDDGEMQCGICGLDFKRMSVKEISAFWEAEGLRRLSQMQLATDQPSQAEVVKLICQDCGGGNAVKGFCPFATAMHNRAVPVVLCEGCRHERAMDI